MKKYLLLFTCVITVLLVKGQSKTKSPVVQSANNSVALHDADVDVYNRAIQFGDYDVAKTALYALLAKHPGNLGYLDSLVIIYYNLNDYVQCVLSGNAYLEKDTSDIHVMEMVALSYSSLKRNKEAVDLYEKMYMRTGKIYFAYQLAVQQYFLKRIGECNQMIDIILNDPASMKETILISIEEGRQNVPLKAAAYNLRGIILGELNMKEKAIENYDASLKIFPDFILAKKNLDALNHKEDDSKK